MATMNGSLATRRVCGSCGLDLSGHTAFPILGGWYCATLHCISKGFIDNVSLIEPSERDRITRYVQRMREYKHGRNYLSNP